MTNQEQNFWGKLWLVFLKFWETITPEKKAKKRASLGLLISVFIVAFFIGAFKKLGFFPSLDPILGIILAMVIIFLFGFLILTFQKFAELLPKFLTNWGLIFAAGFIIFLNFFLPSPFSFIVGLLTVIVESIFFYSLITILKGKYKGSVFGKKIWLILTLGIGLIFNAYIFYWLTGSGTAEHIIKYKVDKVKVQKINLPDPSLRGPYKTLDTYYGSGAYRNRPEFGELIKIKTKTVDATPFIKNNKGFKMKLRKAVLGFEPKEFPLNGHVWYPSGKGPFPLVLVVHGNHNLAEFSDPGYEYLCDFLASRGHIAVSVDENFFNGSIVGSLSKENDGRGWVLLKHLQLWKKWNKQKNNLFYNKVDMENIALIGHSRGGEAAAIAGNFNKLKHYPDDATIDFDFNFNIKSIIAIAPSDGQYKPAGKPNPLENINYLVLQGAHDSDVSIFLGARQYNRVKFTDNNYYFKASIYSYRSNHGQFNTVWGNTDFGWPSSLFINKKALLSGEKQRNFGKIYMSGFLEATLKGKKEYIEMFKDYRKISHWLPEDYYISRFEDSNFLELCTYEEDVNVNTASIEDSSITTKNLKVWREENLSFRSRGNKDNNVVILGWKTNIKSKQDIPYYNINIPEDYIKNINISESCSLVFSAANTNEKIPDDKEKKKKGKKSQDKIKNNNKIKSANFSIELKDSSGNSSRIKLNDYYILPPVLKSKFLKSVYFNKRYGKNWEATLQTVELPLFIFIKTNPSLELNKIKQIRFIFDLSKQDIVILDRIGIEYPV